MSRHSKHTWTWDDQSRFQSSRIFQDHETTPDLPEDDEGLCVGGQGAPLRPLPLPHQVVEVVILQEISQDLDCKQFQSSVPECIIQGLLEDKETSSDSEKKFHI